MRHAPRLYPLLTATHRYDKSLSTRGSGQGQIIEAPILAYLIETPNGRILYDVGCDYSKIADPARSGRYYDPSVFVWGVPEMREEQRVPNQLARLGLSPSEIDVIFLGHLHFDHAGGLADLRGPEVQVQDEELVVALSGEDTAVFADDISGDVPWKRMHGEYELVPGVRAVASPGHTVAHMSLYVEPERGAPILLCGDAADLSENLEREIAPGLCYREREQQAIDSIRKLKRLAHETGAALWPNHDIAFYRSLPPVFEFRIEPWPSLRAGQL
jgi:N-acyl homoserine lactone hydrolase